MATFSFEAPMPTVGLPADCALRIRVRRSAIGSVMLIVRASPTRLRQAWNLTAISRFAQLGARQPEFPVHPARTAGDRAAIALPRGSRIARLALQFRLRRGALFRPGLRRPDQLLELGAPLSVFFRYLEALLLAHEHVRLGHCLYLLTERKVESFKERAPVLVVARRGGNGDVHATDLIDLVVLDFGENDLLLDPQAVIAAAVERARADAAKIPDARNRNAHQ